MGDPPTEELSLIPQADGYVLRRVSHEGHISELSLNETNVLFLPRVAHKAVGQILEKRSTPAMRERGVEPMLSVPAQPISVSETIHGDSVTFEMRDDYGGEFGFALQPDEARWLGERLIARADALASAAPRRTKQ